MLTYEEYKRRNQQITNQLDSLKRKKRELKKQQLLLQKERGEQRKSELDQEITKTLEMFDKGLFETLDKISLKQQGR